MATREMVKFNQRVQALLGAWGACVEMNNGTVVVNLLGDVMLTKIVADVLAASL
jgi:phosphoribosylaminoimidazole carboxylase (NCAIR synthetase)